MALRVLLCGLAWAAAAGTHVAAQEMPDTGLPDLSKITVHSSWTEEQAEYEGAEHVGKLGDTLSPTHRVVLFCPIEDPLSENVQEQRVRRRFIRRFARLAEKYSQADNRPAHGNVQFVWVKGKDVTRSPSTGLPLGDDDDLDSDGPSTSETQTIAGMCSVAVRHRSEPQISRVVVDGSDFTSFGLEQWYLENMWPRLGFLSVEAWKKYRARGEADKTKGVLWLLLDMPRSAAADTPEARKKAEGVVNAHRPLFHRFICKNG